MTRLATDKKGADMAPEKTYPQVVSQRTAMASKGEFQISTSVEMFRMFSSGMYSDPVLAIIREYSTNALDAHRVAKTQDKPFDVHLPDTKNPVFYIRDYGTGMSKEHVETVFQTYGKSTKRDTNLCTGMFGIGSKCAFCYVGSFAILSYYKGMLYKYIGVINDTGKPELMYDGQPIATDEPDGLKIQFAIDPKDQGLFVEAAKKVYAYFDVIPNFIGDVKPFIEKPVYVMEGKEKTFRWGVRQHGSSWGQVPSYIIMGNNKYPISDQLLSAFHKDGIEYYVDIDTFQPASSREAIHWESADTTIFKKLRTQVVTSIADKFKEEIKDMTDWQSINCYAKYSDSLVGHIARETNSYFNNWTIANDANNYTIRFSCNQFWISSHRIQVQRLYKSSRSKNTVVGKNYGNKVKGKDGGALWTMLEITDATPLNIVTYNAKGIAHAANYLPSNTLILGSYDDDPVQVAKDLKRLTDLLSKQKVPFTTGNLADFLKTCPKKAKVSTTTAAPAVKRNTVTGVFKFKYNFESIDDLTGIEYYIPFEAENTFELSKFFTGSDRIKKWADSERYIDNKLRSVSYEDIARALHMPKPDTIGEKICYIRPRFVENHAKQLKCFKDVCDEQLLKVYTDKWEGFMAFLMFDLNYFEGFANQDISTRKEKRSPFTFEAVKLITWLKRTSMSQFWSYKYLRFPFIAQIAAYLATHRITSRSSEGFCTGYACGSYSIDQSDQHSTIEEKYRHLTSWMYPVSTFINLYQGWIDRLNEECRCMLRVAPYLFKSEDNLINNTLIYNGNHSGEYASFNNLTDEDEYYYDDEL